MGRKTASVLLAVVLFAAGASLCIKPVCANLIREAFLGRAVALRANEVIWDWYPDEDLDKAVGIQQTIAGHPRLNRIAAKYLDALAAYTGTGDGFREPDVDGDLEKMNENVLHRLETEFEERMTAEGRKVFLEELYAAEQEAMEILNGLPGYIGNFGEAARTILGFYRVWTSWQFLLALAALAAALGRYTFRKEENPGSWLRHTAIVLLADGAALGILLPAAARTVSYRVTNRVIGRSWMIDVSAFMYAGLVFALLAVGMLAARKMLRTKEKKGIR